MKKLILAATMVLGLAGFSFAQTSTATTTKPVPVKHHSKKSHAKNVATAPEAKPASSTTVTKTAAKPGAGLKKSAKESKAIKANKK